MNIVPIANPKVHEFYRVANNELQLLTLITLQVPNDYLPLVAAPLRYSDDRVLLDLAP